MKKILLLAALIPVLALAQEPVTVEKPVTCFPTKILLESLNKEYKEEPIWIGNASDSRYSLFVNPKTSEFTFIQFNNEVACILGVGSSSRNILTKPTL